MNQSAVVLDFLDALDPLTTLYLPLKFQNSLYPLPTQSGRKIFFFFIIQKSPLPEAFCSVFVCTGVSSSILWSAHHDKSDRLQQERMSSFHQCTYIDIYIFSVLCGLDDISSFLPLVFKVVFTADDHRNCTFK